MKLLAVLINYKTPDMTLDALRSLLRELGPYPDARVTLVDNHGRLLAPMGSGPPGPLAPDGAMAQQARIESSLEKQIVSLLERTIGIGNVSAQVNAVLDWTQSERTEETFDPDSQVVR